MIPTVSIDWIRARTEPELNTGCWLWSGWLNRGGYGRVTVDGKTWQAQRLSWTVANQEIIPDWMYACHRCDTPACVNPDHIFPGTPRENLLDCVSKGRRNSRGHSHCMDEREVRIARHLVSHGIAPGIIADVLHVKAEALLKAIKGRTYSHLPGALPDGKYGKRMPSHDAVQRYFEEATFQ